jgi:hypothetical protein
MPHLAVFGVSCASLAFEVLLARLFAISQWHHLSFMVISIALFGFAASGSLLSRADLSRWSRNDRACQATQIAGASLLCSVSMLFALVGLAHLPLDYFRLVLEPVQFFYLLAVYLLLILPFFFAGAVIAMAYVFHPQQAGQVYFASMTGSALGAAAPVVLLAVIGEVAAAVLSALPPLAAVLGAAPSAFGRGKAPGRTVRLRRAAVLAGAAACAAGMWCLTPEGLRRLQPKSSEYKMLSQVLPFPETRVVESIGGIRGRIERVQSPHLRFAPGLSLKYTEPLPAAEAVFADRDRPLFMYDLDSVEESGFARFTLAFIGYELAAAAPGRVLLFMGTGGLAVACARASGAKHVHIVQPDPNLADRIQRHYAFAQVARETPRAFLARTADGFDVIHIESWGASLPGADALQQDHLLTVEGVTACLRRLTARGALVISRKLLLPPSGTLRLWATAREALVRLGRAEPERSIAMLRNWDTFALLIMPAAAPQRVLEFARRLNFDVVYLQGAAEADANRYNVFDAPYHFQEIRRLENAFRGVGTPGGFFSDYLLDVRPRTDLQPFPDSHLKWDRVGELYRSLGGRLPAFFLSGEVVVAVVFIEALAVAGILLLIPAWKGAGRSRIGNRHQVLYFLGIGAGFILAEMVFIYAGTFILGDPVISLAVVLAALLVSSGAGGLWYQRRGPAAIGPALLATVAALLAAGIALGLFSSRLLALPEIWRYAALAAGTMIPGFAMGAPFPLGMRFLLHRPADKALAWAVNGCASVLASIAAAQMAISAGLHWILAAALFCYGLAFWGSRTSGGKPVERGG